MTYLPPNLHAGETPESGGRARTLAWQGLTNRIVRGVLRTPGLRHIVGNQLVTLYVVGRTSGRRFADPVAYTKHEGTMLIGASFRWGLNLRTGRTC